MNDDGDYDDSDGEYEKNLKGDGDRHCLDHGLVLLLFHLIYDCTLHDEQLYENVNVNVNVARCSELPL